MADDRATCEVCKISFRFRDKVPPRTCGMSACRARSNWSEEQWSGRARMALARAAAGFPLDDLDNEALEREDF